MKNVIILILLLLLLGCKNKKTTTENIEIITSVVEEKREVLREDLYEKFQGIANYMYRYRGDTLHSIKDLTFIIEFFDETRSPKINNKYHFIKVGWLTKNKQLEVIAVY